MSWAEALPLRDADSAEATQCSSERRAHPGSQGIIRFMSAAATAATNDVTASSSDNTAEGSPAQPPEAPLHSWAFDVLQLPAHTDAFSIFRAALDDIVCSEDAGVQMHLADAFLRVVIDNYEQVPYHSFEHALFVFHGTYALLKVADIRCLNARQKALLLVAAMCHDVGHVGLTTCGMRQLHSRSTRCASVTAYKLQHKVAAFAFERLSPLERHHADTCINLLVEKVPLLSKLCKSEADFLRDVILSTDMANHTQYLEEIVALQKQDLLNSDLPWHKRLACAKMLLKTADLGNVAKPWPQAKEWSSRVNDEFVAEGDMLKKLGLEVKGIFSRNSNHPLHTVDFIQQVKPLFDNADRLLGTELTAAAIDNIPKLKRWAQKLQRQL